MNIYHISIFIIVCVLLVTTFNEAFSGVPRTATLDYSSFDGGGPEFRVEIEDKTIVSYKSEYRYNKPNHEELCGAGYDIFYEFKGLKQGKTKVKISARSPIADNFDDYYEITVDEALNVEIEKLETKNLDEVIDEVVEEPIETVEEDIPEPPEFIKQMAVVAIATEKRTFYPKLDNNETANAFFEKLKKDKLDVKFCDSDNFGKVADLPWSLPQNDERILAESGDLVLSQGNRIIVVYDETVGKYTKFGRVNYNVTKEEIMEAFGNASQTVSIYLEWGE